MDRYVATRTTHGWVTTYPGRPGDEYLMAARPQCNLSMDVCIDYQIELPFGFGGTFSYAPFVWDSEGRSLGRWPTNLALVPNGDQSIADDEPSADFSHYVFSSVNAPFAPGGNEAPPGTVYDNDISEKTVTIASVLPGRRPDPAGGRAGRRPEPQDRDRRGLHRRLAHPDGGDDQPVLRQRPVRLLPVEARLPGPPLHAGQRRRHL